MISRGQLRRRFVGTATTGACLACGFLVAANSAAANNAAVNKPAANSAAANSAAAESAAAETRGYVIAMVHTATYADADTCPMGGNGGPVELRTRRLMGAGYGEAEALEIVVNGGRDAEGNRVAAAELFGSFGSGRGWGGLEVNPGNAPYLLPDPHIETAQGRFAPGFNLDGRVDPDDFEDPDTHEKGVDNEIWRVIGCFDTFHVRKPVRAYNENITWDAVLDGMPAWLISVSGEDLGRDGDVTVTFDRALNVALRDATGGLLSGATYTIDPDPRSHSEFRGRIDDQVLTIEPGDFSMQGESQFYAILRLTNTHLRLQMFPDGSVTGLLGGYQPWSDYYQWLAVRGENDGQIDLPGVYYAMKRLADGVPDPATGNNTAISATYWLQAVPAFHTDMSGGVVSVAVGPGPKLSGPAAIQIVAPPGETEAQQ